MATKPIIYQLLVRLFGNKESRNVPYGTVEENGVGKFRDITKRALKELKELGATHIWYTGVLEHATMTDYSAYSIPAGFPEIVKGRAGSPYSIKDYYDVCPDLAEDVPGRMKEFEALLKRTHEMGLKALIDFVPNHVARKYYSDARPTVVADLGEGDDPTKAFSPQNNFYYLPGQNFVVPANYQPLGKAGTITYIESPAKATGNDVFSAQPTIDDWFEAVKLNYGVDYQNGRKTYFDPVPNTWNKMCDILLYWAEKGVDGFRCDMAEMTPVEFWAWVIPQVKERRPDIVFIAEIYNPKRYHDYLFQGRFDYLYDKVDVYDALRAIVTGRSSVTRLSGAWAASAAFSGRMLRFMENHDEQRIASPEFAGDARAGIPTMCVSALSHTGPVMLYFGQEVGEPGAGAEGFNRSDGRTTIFDYWGVPKHRQWMNEGKFDGGALDAASEALRDYYKRLFHLCQSCEAISEGNFYEMPPFSGDAGPYVYAFWRFTARQQLLIVVNFHPTQHFDASLYIPEQNWLTLNKNPLAKHVFKDILMSKERFTFSSDTKLRVEPFSAYVYELG